MVNFTALVLRPAHKILGVWAVYTPAAGGSSIDFICIDQVKNITVPGTPDSPDMGLVYPSVNVLRENMPADAADMIDGAVVVNGTSYKVLQCNPAVSPDGLETGEYALILDVETA
jgi:hypothetical protein